MLRARPWNDGRIKDVDPPSGKGMHDWSGKATRDDKDIFVAVVVHEGGSTFEAPVARVVVIEPAAMASGQVTVLLDQLKGGLQAEGKIALHGLYFDTGKAEIKPQSKAQLDEMARLLKADPALRVFIVGHTDSQGTLEANLALSQKRADAVVEALVKQHGIDARRLAARGIANVSPLASNAAESGRAKNRRVELVAQ